ncbi:hypothetical protein CPB86DRAFT_796109 [Serendipita vermifera]|nr:hypothetical protein CPB86DRAFT_796109 [Serendipita vermifera]
MSCKSEEEEARDKLGPLPENLKRTVDITGQLVERWSRPISATSLQLLRAHLQQPLTEEENVPVTQKEFNDPCVPYSDESPGTALSDKQLSTLFRVSAEEEALGPRSTLTTAIRWGPPTHGTEDAFISTWDVNISCILRLVLSDAKTIRNSNRNTSTDLKRPDYGFLLKNNCDITQKPWSLKKDRVANIVYLIRLSEVMVWLGQQLHKRNRPEFTTFKRNGGLVHMDIAAVVRKEFMHEDAAERVSKLVEIYDLLKSKGVPNVDTLEGFDARYTKNSYPHVYLSPVGLDKHPESGSEAFDAVFCVLEALKVMHSGPNPVYHRDIWESNIINKVHGQGWFLIDWSDASTAPTRAVTHLKESTHSDRVFQDNHGAEVDIWGIAKYMEILACRVAKPDDVEQMARRWMEDITTSAASALDEIRAARELFIATPF